MTTIETIADPQLREFAQTLLANGFTVWLSKGSLRSSYITYSQMVDDKECFGTVSAQRIALGGSRYTHLMPIRPSREYGSSMWVEGVPNELSLEAAQKVAQPTNRNHVVGQHENWPDPRFINEANYDKIEPAQ